MVYRIFPIIVILSIVFSNSHNILSEISSDLNWMFLDEINDKEVFEHVNENCHCTFLKIEKKINFTEESILNVISDINNYNEIIQNTSIKTNLIEVVNDTILAHQIIKNSIPFVRDRQYLFKMYLTNENSIEWFILKKNSDFLSPFFLDDVRTLTVGAGTWSFRYENSDKILINKIYVDDEVNLPIIFLNKFRKENVIKIFDDIMSYIEKIEEI